MSPLPIEACLSNVVIEHAEAHMTHLPGSMDIQVQVKCHESDRGGGDGASVPGIHLVLTLDLRVNDADAGDEAVRFKLVLSGVVSDLEATSDLKATDSDADSPEPSLSDESAKRLRSLGLDALYGQAVAQVTILANGMGLGGLPLPIIAPGTLQSALPSRDPTR